jgi:hypothetical protein
LLSCFVTCKSYIFQYCILQIEQFHNGNAPGYPVRQFIRLPEVDVMVDLARARPVATGIVGDRDMADPALPPLECGNGIALHDPLGLPCSIQQKIKDR